MYISLNEIKTLTLEVIKRLVDNKIQEGKSVDYKESLSVNTNDEKKEFLADVSSFANADGGNLIYGVKEVDGIPTDICGFKVDSIDAEILKLENLIRDCTDPRVQGALINYITLDNGQFVLVIYIPKSFNPPHVVKFGSHWKFYSRNSAGKYPLDVTELKSIISLSDTVQERIRNFRIERISRIKNKELPIPIINGPKFIYHIIPLSSFATNELIDIAKFEHSSLRYDFYSDLRKIYNYDGILVHDFDGVHPAVWYNQIFRNGSLEVFKTGVNYQGIKVIGFSSFEQDLINGVSDSKTIFEFFGLNFPIIIFHSILDIQDYSIQAKSLIRSTGGHPFTQNDFLLPEILLNESQLDNLPLALKPLFDPIWNAVGYPQSPNFNPEGEWKVK